MLSLISILEQKQFKNFKTDNFKIGKSFVKKAKSASGQKRKKVINAMTNFQQRQLDKVTRI